MATWNVQGIRNKEQEVVKEIEKMKIDICVLTETKKKRYRKREDWRLYENL